MSPQAVSSGSDAEATDGPKDDSEDGSLPQALGSQKNPPQTDSMNKSNVDTHCYVELLPDRFAYFGVIFIILGFMYFWNVSIDYSVRSIDNGRLYGRPSK